MCFVAAGGVFNYSDLQYGAGAAYSSAVDCPEPGSRSPFHRVQQSDELPYAMSPLILGPVTLRPCQLTVSPVSLAPPAFARMPTFAFSL